MIWFVVPVMMIVCNDVMAYMFGFFFGKTPLIKLSPKKTWEGFIGGGFATVIFGVVFSYFLARFQYFVCPIEYSETAGKIVLECEPSYLFRPQEYGIRIVSNLLALILQFCKILDFFFREKLRQFSQCIHLHYIPCHWASSAPSLVHLAASLLQDLNVHLKSRWDNEIRNNLVLFSIYEVL